MEAQESHAPSEVISDDALSGISAFVARVLNQLSLSAWLPSAFLTVSGSFLLQFRAQRSLNFAHAATSLTKDPATILILAVPVLVSSTLVTQAFSFEAIKVLEGYWRRSGITSLIGMLMIRWHVHRKTSLRTRRKKAYARAFANARPRLLEAKVRILPTRLGNSIRATEDKLKHVVDEDLEGFVLQQRDNVSRRVLQQHDQFRARLEMYCILVFASGLLTVSAPVLLIGRSIQIWEILTILGGFAAVSFASYQAAIASAKGYCAALKQIDNAVKTLLFIQWGPSACHHLGTQAASRHGFSGRMLGTHNPSL